MNMMLGSNAYAAIKIEAEETIAELSKITAISAENCGKVKDRVDAALRLSKDIDESRKLAKQPHQDAGNAVDAAYNPLRDNVAAIAKAVKAMVEAWALSEKRKAEAEAAEARRKADDLAKAQADEDPFLADESEMVQAATVVAIAETRAVAARQVTSAAGVYKASSFRKVRSALVTDPKALALHYAEHPDVLSAATKCANAAIRAAKGGPLVIPGVTIEEKEVLV